VRCEVSYEGGNCKQRGDESNQLESQWTDDLPNQEMNDTELFFDENKGLYKNKGDKETDQ